MTTATARRPFQSSRKSHRQPKRHGKFRCLKIDMRAFAAGEPAFTLYRYGTKPELLPACGCGTGK